MIWSCLCNVWVLRARNLSWSEFHCESLKCTPKQEVGPSNLVRRWSLGKKERRGGGICPTFVGLFVLVLKHGGIV